jgi:hypothetical protein
MASFINERDAWKLNFTENMEMNFNYTGKIHKYKEYFNPIGQTGAFFTLRIDIENNNNNKYYKIIINNAIDYLKYEDDKLPIWATEFISVLIYYFKKIIIIENILFQVIGGIKNIKFGANSDKCKPFIKTYEYPLNIINIPNHENLILQDGSLIFINGIISENLISISFLHKALEWHPFSLFTLYF